MAEPSAAPLSDFYARLAERKAVAEREWHERQPFGPFRVSEHADRWAAEVVAGTSVAALLLTRQTATTWSAALGLSQTYIGFVVSELARVAVEAGALVLPEAGVVLIGYAHRDPATERETALGWGFIPAAAEALVVFAEHALPIDELAGSSRRTGPSTVVGVLDRVADTLSRPRLGTVQLRDRV